MTTEAKRRAAISKKMMGNTNRSRKGRYSIYIDEETELLIPELGIPYDNMSEFLQTLIRGYAARVKGIEVVTVTEIRKVNDG
jgi:hypothetical protein